MPLGLLRRLFCQDSGGSSVTGTPLYGCCMVTLPYARPVGRTGRRTRLPSDPERMHVHSLLHLH
ncbi:hypothetical protein GCM10027605_24890 [Micromonospora zhanjiangensis]